MADKMQIRDRPQERYARCVHLHSPMRELHAPACAFEIRQAVDPSGAAEEGLIAVPQEGLVVVAVHEARLFVVAVLQTRLFVVSELVGLHKLGSNIIASRSRNATRHTLWSGMEESVCSRGQRMDLPRVFFRQVPGRGWEACSSAQCEKGPMPVD